MHRNRVVRKFLGQTPATSNDVIDPPNSDFPQQLRPNASQSAVYAARSPLTCLDRSPDGQRAIIAGPNVLKILRVNGSSVKEEVDLRSTITSSTIVSDPTTASAEQFNIGAIKWSPNESINRVITASGNGRITIYDLNHIGGSLEVARINYHKRQVHKLDINPHNSAWVLSASHDGTVKSFDLREPTKNISQLGGWGTKTFTGNADAVRDVAWSPKDGVEFASSTDAGVIMKWDWRKTKIPVLSLRAHSKPCFAIAWHIDGEHMISGGMDQVCKVWSLSNSAQKNQSPRYVFSTPYPISSVGWRPASWSGTSKARRSAQVSVVYDPSTTNKSPLVHLWDLARPSFPYKEFDTWSSAPTGSLWNTRDLLWCVDGLGNFTQTDVAFVPKALDDRSVSNFAFSPRGDALLFMEERHPTARVRRSVGSQDDANNYQPELPSSIFSTSRSDSEDDAVAGFLGARRPRHHERRRSDRSTNQFNTLGLSSTSMAEMKNMTLIESVGITGVYSPKQVMAIGPGPGAMQRSLYQYYSNCYLAGLEKYNEETKESLPIRLAKLMEQYARSAAAGGHYRLAQTWRILSLTMHKLLTERAEYHRQRRLAPPEQSKVIPPAQRDAEVANRSEHDFDTPRRGHSVYGAQTPARSSRSHTPHDSPGYNPGRSTIYEDPESTSNVATPLVRPKADSVVHQTREAMHTSLIVENDPLDLTQPATPAPIPVPTTSSGTKPARSSMEGYDFYDMESISAAIPFNVSQKRAPLQLDSGPQRIQPVRHDSEDSFQMFSTSSDSQGKYMSSSESDGRNSYQANDRQAFRNRVSSWEGSFGSEATQSSGGSEETNSHYNSGNFSAERRNGGINPPPVLPVFRLQEASEPMQGLRPPIVVPPVLHTKESPATPTVSKDPEIIQSDYHPWPNDPSFVVQPLNPAVLVQNTIDYEASKGALHASILILLLRPLLPEDSIDKYQAPAILRTYHQRLTSFQLFLEATSLRKLCVPDYPVVYASSQQNVTIGFCCTDCHKPIENDPNIPQSQWRCPRCQQYLDGCAVCKSRSLLNETEYSEEDIGRTRNGLWWYCNGCGHGGHVTCMKAWHASTDSTDHTAGDKYSGGCCPITGCLHPCLPGNWRNEREAEKVAKNARALEAQTRENARSSISRGSGRGFVGVRKDAKEVNQSKAVEGVRATYNVAQLNSMSGTSGSGVSRSKSVKITAPGEDGLGGSRFNR